MDTLPLTLLLLGGHGQLGTVLYTRLSPFYKVIRPSRSHLDVREFKNVASFFQESEPNIVINCTGFLDVPGAESHPDTAQEVNVNSVRNLGLLCEERDIPLIHYSTDYVFEGTLSRPYHEEDLHSPLNMYGRTKSLGEKALQEVLEKHFIVRTCWLYSPFRRNFVNFILNASKEKKDLTIVDDQRGSPTPASLVAQGTYHLLKHLTDPLSSDLYGTYHLAAEGDASWFEFALEIKKVFNLDLKITPLSTEEFNMKNAVSVQRPSWSVLSSEKFSRNFNFKCPTWQESLKEVYQKEFKDD